MARAKVQLCGRLVVELDGERVEERLPGRQGRLLFAFLAANRNRTLTRDALLLALWADGRDSGLAPLLSKLRRVVSLEDYRLELPPDAWVDIEAAEDAVHRAESAIAQRDFHRAWGPSQVAMFIAGRPFLPGEDAAWIDEMRRRLDELHLRALEAYAQAGLGIGGTELAAAVRTGRELMRREPYRETGYRLLMEALASEGNVAESLRVYDDLRRRLRDDLGVAPSPPTQELHRQLLQRSYRPAGPTAAPS
ncbi:MAG TPA: BTAD domain-containing putative transcriptional regulator [Gaiellaceae bacterium]|nr:BTAD domain-containing putative transcriptional regulator [Gaiellaceae bacterium]